MPISHSDQSSVHRLVGRIADDEPEANSSSCGDGAFDRAMRRSAQDRIDDNMNVLLAMAAQSWDVYRLIQMSQLVP